MQAANKGSVGGMIILRKESKAKQWKARPTGATPRT
jgi:hypothetical protein